MKNKQIRCIAEGAVMVALALALSYLKIPTGLAFGGFGGSIDLVMIPLIVYAVHRGCGWGLMAGLVFGTLKYFFAGGTAINWESMLLDYSIAYMFVGFAGLMRGKRQEGKLWALPLGALIGCACRFVIHFISGVTIYAEYFEDVFLGVAGLNPFTYSILYNGTYMLPNTVLAIVLCALLAKPLELAFKRMDG
jgi:thiamine transporter